MEKLFVVVKKYLNKKSLMLFIVHFPLIQPMQSKEELEQGWDVAKVEILQKEIASLLTIASEYEKSEKENVESAQRIDGG